MDENKDKDIIIEAVGEEKREEAPREAGLEDSVEAGPPDSPEKELEEAKARILRLHADFENYRKRVQKEKEEWFHYAALSMIEKLLPVVDNLERALDSINRQDDEVKSLYSGVTLTYRQLKEILEREGLQPIEALGQIFDPVLHEAIMQAPAEEGQPDNLIVEELRKGYRFKDKIVRPAMVKVAKIN